MRATLLFPQENFHGHVVGNAGKLEIMTTYPKTTPTAVGIICHPHPLYGGTMNNKVVTTIARAWQELGWATVRFNFRGVGQSEGDYGHTQGEMEDLRTIITWAQQQLPHLPLALAGFSFGAFIAARVAAEISLLQLVTIAPPVNHFDFTHLAITCPWLIIHGSEDEIVPVQEVIAWAQHLPVNAKFILLPQVSHFFHGHLLELREHLKA